LLDFSNRVTLVAGVWELYVDAGEVLVVVVVVVVNEYDI